jgi:hypothetical protein
VFLELSSASIFYFLHFLYLKNYILTEKFSEEFFPFNFVQINNQKNVYLEPILDMTSEFTTTTPAL